MTAKKQKRKIELKAIKKHLAHGAQVEIASRLKESKHNVQHAFRGDAGEDLTKLVLQTAKRLPARFFRIDKKQALNLLTKTDKNVLTGTHS